MALTNKISGVRLSPWDYSLFLYGEPKVGKSTFCSQIPNALFADFEGGLNALSVYKEPEEGVFKSWAHFKDVAREFLSSDDHSFKVLVIDTLSECFNLCLREVSHKLGLAHPSDAGHGKGWDELYREFFSVINALSTAHNRGLVIICHAEEVPVRTKISEYLVKSPKMTKGARRIVIPQADIIAYFCVEPRQGMDGKLVYENKIKLAPSPYHVSGSRVRFPGAGGTIPESIPMDYQYYIDLFKEGTMDK